MAERWLPREVAWRRKGMFRAPFDSFHLEPAPAFVDQLLSPESLRRTGYFDPEAVRTGARRTVPCGTAPCGARPSKWAWSR